MAHRVDHAWGVQPPAPFGRYPETADGGSREKITLFFNDSRRCRCCHFVAGCCGFRSGRADTPDQSGPRAGYRSDQYGRGAASVVAIAGYQDPDAGPGLVSARGTSLPATICRRPTSSDDRKRRPTGLSARRNGRIERAAAIRPDRRLWTDDPGKILETQ